MAVLKPFKAVRPKAEYASRVGALPYDVMNSDEAREKVKGNPYSFLHVDKAEIDLPLGTDIYSEAVYEKAKENLNALEKNGICEQDEKPMLYIYRQVMNGREQTGIVGCTAVDDYLNNIIKKHEFTRADKEADRIHHVDTCDANTGPIFLTHRENKTVSDITVNWKNTHSPVYDFVSDDGVGQTVWVVDDDETVNRLVEEFKDIPYLYIADGHHRAASAVRVGQRRRGEGEYDKNAEFNFFLSVIFPCDELKIMDYNRVIADLNGFTAEEFLEKISGKFTVEKAEQSPFAPQSRHTFGMYLDGVWIKLRQIRNTLTKQTPWKGLMFQFCRIILLPPYSELKTPEQIKESTLWAE